VIPLAVPNLSGNEAKYLQECIESTFVSSVGPFVNRFEEKVASLTGAKKGVATSSGTTGLHIALLSAGVKPGDLVIIPSFTFIASANAVAHCGAEPWLFDVDETWTLNAELLKEQLQSLTQRQDGKLIHQPSGKTVAAIMPVHTLGTPCDMDSITKVAKDYQIPVVVDAACALGVKYKGQDLAVFGDLSVISFNGNKTVTAGAGGVIVGQDEALLSKARHLSTTARVSLDYDHDVVGFNYRMTNLQAAVGCAQLERLEEFVAIKKRIRKKYNEAFKDIKGLGFYPESPWGESVCWFSGVVIEDPKLPSVGDMGRLLKEKGIESRPFWKPIHLQRPYANAPKTEQKISNQIWNKILTLPCSTHLTEKDQDFVITSVRQLLR